MASTKIIAANATKNNSGVTTYGGNVGTLMASADFNELSIPAEANKVTSTQTGAAPSGVATTIIAAGTYAGMVAGQYVGIGYDVTLANYSAQTSMIGAGDVEDRVSIMASTGVYTINYTDWSYMSGIASSSNSLTYFAPDNVATPTRAVPGSLITLQTGATPEVDDYSSKTG
jgi:hypothetical protein